MTIPSKWAKRLASSIGLQVTRASAASRFSAMDECLSRMKASGFAPRVVIDGGANEGQFYRSTRILFPDAHFHLVEPQPQCSALLRALVERRPRTTELHCVALAEPGVSSLRMNGCGTTGAYVARRDEGYEIEVPAASLDSLFSSRITLQDRCLLKLDLESHELKALAGAGSMLPRVEAVVVEVSFYDVEKRGGPTFSDVMRFMTGRDFEFFDVAALASRPRDNRLRMGDVVFVRRGTPLVDDRSWD